METIYKFPGNELSFLADSKEHALERYKEYYGEEDKEPFPYYTIQDIVEEEHEDHEELDEKYGIVRGICKEGDDPCLETFGEDLKKVKMTQPDHVWTIVDSDNGLMYAVPGYHHVNRINYIITEKPWDYDSKEYLW
jgi:hypothetical protein